MKMVYRFFIFLLMCYSAFAREIYYLQRSPIALMMGDAFTSLADDEYTLFYNPAALARNSGVSLSIINPDITVTNALTELDRFKDFPKSDAAAISDRLLGFPVHLHIGLTPGLKMDQIGLNYFVNNSTNIMLRNAIHPSLDIDYRYDRGIIAGFAISQKNPGKTKGYSRKLSGASNHSLGFAVKRVSRDSLDQSYDLFGTKLLNLIASGDTSDIDGVKKSLGYGSNSAWGVDVGWLSTFASTGKEFNFGASLQNIGGLRFAGQKDEVLVPDDPMNLNLGTSYRQEFSFFHYVVSADMHPILAPISTYRKLHFGMEFGLPFISALWGWNGGYGSYGIMLNLWVMKLYAGLYGIEIGSGFQEQVNKRAVIYLSIFNVSFDG